MKTIALELYIEYAELEIIGIPTGTLKAALVRNSKSWQKINDPDDSRCTLFKYETLTPRVKKLIAAKYGDPYIYHQGQTQIENTPIDPAITLPGKVELDLQEWGLIKSARPGGKALTDGDARAYSRACAWLKLLNSIPYRPWALSLATSCSALR